LGLAAAYVDARPGAALGGLLMLANWPYTLIAIAPTNKRLGAVTDREAGRHSRALIVKWGKLHAVRTLLGLAATCAFLFAMVAK
jgi:hypothetical protein